MWISGLKLQNLLERQFFVDQAWGRGRVGACSPHLFIDFDNKYSSEMAIASLQLQKMENNSWLIRPEEEVVSAHVLLTFDVRLQRCGLLLLWKRAHFFRSIWNNLIRFSSVQMTGMLHFDGSGFPGASLHIVRTSLFWQNRYFIFRSQRKNVHESPLLAIFFSLTSCDLFVINKQNCQSQSSVRLGMLE